MKGLLKKGKTIILLAIMLVALFGISASTEETTLVIDLSTSGKVSLSVSEGVKYYALNNGEKIEYTGRIGFTGTAPSGTYIEVLGGQHNVELIDATIERSSGAAVDIIGTGTGLNMTVTGTNTVRSGSGYAGIDAISGTFILITPESTGTLYAYGGLKAAGIGGGNTESSGDVIIMGGTIYAYGGNHGAGIGGGREGSGDIKIEGGIIFAQGGNGGGVAVGNGKANSADTQVILVVPEGKEVYVRASQDDTDGYGPYTGTVDITDVVAAMKTFYCDIGEFKREDIDVDGGDGDIVGNTIVLGIDNGDGTYSLFDDVIGWWFITETEERFVDAGLYEVFGGEIIHKVDLNVSMIEGAQVRYGGGLDSENKVSATGGNGIRFAAKVDRSVVGDDVVTGYGMLIEAEGSTAKTQIEANKWQNEDKTIYTAAITNLAVSNFNRNFTASPYAHVKYTDGSNKTVYGTHKVTRSIYYVATGLLKYSDNGVSDKEDIYGVGVNYGLYDVLNAYVNMVGIRLSLDQDMNVSVREGSGAYSGEAFFDVESVDNGDGSVTVTIRPVSENFKNPVKIADYWNQFIRINNNNSSAVKYIDVENSTIDENGTLTFVFDKTI